ncbi:MAG TPA: glycosyltransferase family 39 protein [Gemmataceae bacterium]|nr:glycosyltransferase family 39 protein [Gemmataceae bacterium]
MTPTTDDRSPDRWRLAFVLGLATVVHVYAVANTTVPSRDTIVFTRYALHLETPGGTWKEPDRQLNNTVEVVKENEHPPGYPAAVLLMSKVVRPFFTEPGGVPTAESMGMSAQVVSAIAGILFAIPGYFLVRRVFDRNVATGALAIFEVLPVFVDVTSDGLSDGLFLLTAVTALWFAARALDAADRTGAMFNGLGAGLACGFGSLTRPDSAITAGALGLTFLGALVLRKRAGEVWRVPLLAGFSLVVGWLVAFGPYMALVGGISNKPAANELLGGDGKPVFFQRPAAPPPKAVPPPKEKKEKAAVATLPFAVWWDPAVNAGENKAVWAVTGLWSEYWKAAHYLAPFFALIGLFSIRRRLTDARVALLLVFLGCFTFAHWFLAWKVGYVSQRHTLPEVFVTVVFATTAFPFLGATATRWWGIGWPWMWGTIWVAIFLATALPRDLHSLHEERAGHKACGLWLRKYGDPAVEVLDSLAWSEWYAGRTVTKWPNPRPTQAQGPVRYVIYEPNDKSPHSRLPRYDEAKRLATKPDSKIVYQYPEDAAPKDIVVAVYECKTGK